jgi:superfamily II DNA or RNA helicase
MYMQFFVSNTTTKVVGSSDERSWLDEYLSFTDNKAHFSGAPPKRRYFNRANDTFHTGFMPMILRAAPDAQVQIEVHDTRETTSLKLDEEADLTWLRPYQLEAVDRILDKSRGILWVPTGGGKTEIAAGLAKTLPAVNILFLVHKTQLMEQAAERYERRTGERAGRIGEGKWSVERFTCATFQTLYQGLKRKEPRVLALLQYTEGVIVDECHTLPADSFWKVLSQCHRAYWRVGLSGTPLGRDDSKSLNAIALLGPVIYRIKPEVLQEAGVLAVPRIHLLKYQVPGEYQAKSDWHSTYARLVERDEGRNAVVLAAAKLAPKPSLLFVKGIDHGKKLSKLLWKAGVKNEFVWGEHSTEYRNALVRRLENGSLDMLVCSTVFNEGVDIPCLASCVIAAGGKSTIAAIQRVGRALRVAPGKSASVDIYDVFEEGCGCAQVAKEWGTGTVGQHPGCKWLERHAKERKRSYETEGYTTVVEELIP